MSASSLQTEYLLVSFYLKKKKKKFPLENCFVCSNNDSMTARANNQFVCVTLRTRGFGTRVPLYHYFWLRKIDVSLNAFQNMTNFLTYPKSLGVFHISAENIHQLHKQTYIVWRHLSKLANFLLRFQSHTSLILVRRE